MLSLIDGLQHPKPSHDLLKGMLPAVAKLAQNGKGAAARLNAKHKAPMCSKSFPMIRRLFDAVVRLTVSYGCEVWDPACSLPMGPEVKDMLGVLMALFRQLRKSVTPKILFEDDLGDFRKALA